MKKKKWTAPIAACIVTAVVIALAIAIPAARSARASYTGTLPGEESSLIRRRVDYDVSGNGVVNIRDVTQLLDALSVGDGDPKYDLNGDGKNGIQDVTALLDYLGAPEVYDGFYPANEGTVYFSPSSAAAANGKVFVADATANALYRYSGGEAPDAVIPLEGGCSKVKVMDGEVCLLSGGYNGKLTVYDEMLEELYSVRVGHTPVDLARYGGRIFVINRFSGTLSVIDPLQRRVIAALEVGREPIAAEAVGGRLFIASHLQSGSALGDRIAAEVTVVDMDALTVTERIALQDGVTGIGGMTLLPDGKTLCLTHTVARYSYPTTQLDRGWVNTNGFTLLDADTGVPTAILLDDVESGAANPKGVCCSPDGSALYIALGGTGEVVRLDLAALEDKVAAVKAGRNASIPTADRIIDRVGFTSDCKIRVRTGGEGLRALTYEDGKLLVCAYFDGVVSRLDPDTLETIGGYAPGEQPEKSPERLGEALWNDATYCYQTWESCSSCHPDGRPDGLNWDEGGDGWGTPKNTKSMIFSTRTPPVLATGVVQSAEDNVMGTVREAFRSTLEDDKVECMNAYLRSLLPVPSPYLAPDGGYTPEALRGKELFESKGCAVCHPAPLYTDLRFHRSPYLGSDGSLEDRAFITPTLVEIWRSAPYTYCGCETDLSEVIRTFSRDELTDAEVSDLKAFLLSIGTVGEYYGVVSLEATSGGSPVYGRLIPGMRVTSLTFVKQIPSASGVPDATITVQLTAPDGRILFRRNIHPGETSFGVPVTSPILLNVPQDLPEGSVLSVRFLSDKNGDLATPYTLTCG